MVRGSELKFVKYLEGSGKRFRIPLCRRNCDRKRENCRQLFDDLVKVARTGRSSHFFGSVVSIHNPDGDDEEFLIIDGQQRITTVSLLLLALRNLLEAQEVTAENGDLSKKIYEEYLIDKWKPEETRIKLKPVKKDRQAFERLFHAKEDFIASSKLTGNYEYFCERIKRGEVEPDELFSAVCKLEIISIMLKAGEDNPQLIFESLNSTGLALTEGDKIRNYVLMGLDAKQQDEYYDRYWSKIEDFAGDISAFVRAYLCVKLISIPRQNEVYLRFKAYVEENGLDTKQLLEELLAYARRYRTIREGGTPDRALNACLDRLNRLETTVTHPFFLEVLRLQDEGRLSAADTAEIFRTTEAYIFRRTICELPTSALNKIFAALHREIVRYDKTDAAYLQKFKYALLSKTETGRFPRNEEFKESFSARDIYSMQAKNRVYIFERLENYGTLEDKDIYRHLDAGDYSIEHIMPQHLTPRWKEELGPDFGEIHEKWLNKLANLTLTAYNAKYGNNTFEQKKTMDHGFMQSGLRLNSFIAAKTKWTLEELEERNARLMKEALEIWPLPTSTFKPKEKEAETFTLDDEADMTGKLVEKFAYKGAEQPVKNWIDLYERVLGLLHAEDKTVLAELVGNPHREKGLAPYFSAAPGGLRHDIRIDDGIYAEANTSTDAKLSLLRMLFKKYNAEPSSLVIFLKAENRKKRTKQQAG